MNKSLSTGLIIVGVLVLIFLAWGLIGGNEAQSVGVTCDFGLGQDYTLCWNWHTNAIGQAQEAIDDFLNK